MEGGRRVGCISRLGSEESLFSVSFYCSLKLDLFPPIWKIVNFNSANKNNSKIIYCKSTYILKIECSLTAKIAVFQIVSSFKHFNPIWWIKMWQFRKCLWRKFWKKIMIVPTEGVCTYPEISVISVCHGRTSLPEETTFTEGNGSFSSLTYL